MSQKDQKEFKLKNSKIDINAKITMPDYLKSEPSEHSQFCHPEGNKCIYLCDKENTQQQ